MVIQANYFGRNQACCAERKFELLAQLNTLIVKKKVNEKFEINDVSKQKSWSALDAFKSDFLSLFGRGDECLNLISIFPKLVICDDLDYDNSKK